MSPPLVSILIPCHNAGPWLGATLESALAQTWPNREIILVNDGSTDHSLALARGFESRGVRVLDQPNQGAAAARNAALRVAQGDWIQFLDADDLLAPDKIARQIALDGGDVPMLSGSWGRFHDDPAGTVWDHSPLLRDLSALEFARAYLSTNSMMHPAAWLVRRAPVLAAGPWDERLSLNDDGEYFFRVGLAAGRIVYCPEARSHYRTGHATSLSWQHSRRHLESAHLAVALIVERALAFDPSLRAAAANAWLKFAYEYYPAEPDLVATAEHNAVALGGGWIQPEGGRFFRFFCPLLGWKLARRLQHLTRRHAVIRPA